MKIAVISDTHRLLRPSFLPFLKDIDLILHAGDIGSIKVITELKEVVPTMAVKGNVDEKKSWGNTMPEIVSKSIEGIQIKMIHDPEHIPSEWFEDGTHIIIYGHTHKPLATKRGETLLLNPGSIGPRRFNLPISFVLMEIKDGSFSYEFVELEK